MKIVDTKIGDVYLKKDMKSLKTKTKQCVVCNKDFEALHGLEKYCPGEQCRKRAFYDRNRSNKFDFSTHKYNDHCNYYEFTGRRTNAAPTNQYDFVPKNASSRKRYIEI